MTTTVKVRVNGNYIATVVQDSKPSIEVLPNEEKSFEVPHPRESTFRIIERPGPEAKVG